MLKIEINEKEYRIPSSFDEMNLEQYCKAFYNLPKYGGDEEDKVAYYRHLKNSESIIMSRIMGEADDFCINLPLSVYSRILSELKFVYDSEGLLKNTRASIEIDGERYWIPNFEQMSMRQYIDADMVMKEEDNDMQYIEMLAILLLRKDSKGEFEVYDGNYQDKIEKIRKLSCSIALPLVYHYYKKKEVSKKLSQVSMKVERANQLLQNIVNS